MSQPEYKILIKQLLNDNPDEAVSARQTLLALDEDNVNPLLDEFYAGVNETQGITILDMLAEIGGYEALNALRSICFFDLSTRPQFRKVAAKGLLLNSDNLSPDEHEKATQIANEESA